MHAKLIVLIALLQFIPAHCLPTKISLSRPQAGAIGQRIWQNECNKSIAGLTSWNKNEAFASMGIAHFIWFPRDCTAPFTQTFPALLMFLKKHGVALPPWLAKNTHCPWQSRDAFIAAQESAHMRELSALLRDTVDLQVMFIVERMQHALPAMVKKRSRKDKKHITMQFYRVAQSPNGLYALIDYINFKGEGTNVRERYAGYGWGLVQVLENMDDAAAKKNPTQEFARAAEFVLRRRVHNAPNKNVEERFLPGWLNRVRTYKKIPLCL